jgi:hypothetical protein
VSASYVSKISRRVALQWLAAASAASVLPQYARAGGATLVAFNPTTGGLGTDPDLNHPVVPWRRIMEPPELRQTAVLADLILPGSNTAPAPSAWRSRFRGRMDKRALSGTARGSEDCR